MSLKRAREASAEFKDPVFGFVREHEKKECIKVTAMIKYLVLNYYFLNETFVEPGRHIELNEGSVAKCISSECGDVRGECVFGSIDVNGPDDGIGEYKWTFRISMPPGPPPNSFKLPMTLRIGLSATPNQKNPLVSGICFNRCSEHLCATGTVDSFGGVEIGRFNLDEEVQMMFETANKKLSFHVNGRCVHHLGRGDYFKGFGTEKLRLMIRMYGRGFSVQLINFYIKHRCSMKEK